MTHASAQHQKIDCQYSALCTEVHDWRGTFEYYSGHDEPSALFYSTTPGSGNHQTYQLTLPTEPTAAPGADGTGGSWDFQLHPAFWFGMAMCDPNSYPEVRKDCHPDSDSNIAPLAQHAGTAFMEMQFYPPGWTAWPDGTSCDATHWCAAMNIDSLSEDPIHGTVQNPSCAEQAGIEYVNFAWITKNGVPNGPASPVNSTVNTFSPGPNNFLMNQGDNVTVKIGDTASGLRIDLVDNTSHTSGFMVASSKNGFGGVAYQPTGTNCVNVPMDFHPMYSTSQPPTTFACGSNTCAHQDGTRVPWAAHSYNIAFSDEIGHFDWCSRVVSELDLGGPPGTSVLGNCATWAKENPGLAENSDSDDTGCFNGHIANDYVSGGSHIPGCLGSNNGFDGASYAATRWPSSSSTAQNASTPTPIQFTAPLTGAGDTHAYDSVAFEADVPRITGLNVTDYLCSRTSGKHCLMPMATDDQNVDTATTGDAFYPTFGVSGCNYWEGHTGTTAGSQYGWSGINAGTYTPVDPTQVWKLSYLAFGGGGAISYRFNDMNKVAGAPVSC